MNQMIYHHSVVKKGMRNIKEALKVIFASVCFVAIMVVLVAINFTHGFVDGIRGRKWVSRTK